MKRIFVSILCVVLLLTGCGVEISSRTDKGDPVDKSDTVVSGDSSEPEVSDTSEEVGNSIETNLNDEFEGENVGEVDEDYDNDYGNEFDTDTGGADEIGEVSEITDYDSSDMVIRLGSSVFDLEKPVDYKALVNMTEDELGILRNAIFAKHGYKFKTEKYKEYFSGFEWYSPLSEDVNSKLTKEDKAGIALIQKVENRFFGGNIQLSEEEKELIGHWEEGAVAAAGFSDMYRFYSDGVYKFTVSQMNCSERTRTHAGKWFILDGYLYLRIEKEGNLVGGELIECEIHGPEIVDADYVISPLATFIPAVYNIDFNTPQMQEDYRPIGVLIDGSGYYQFGRDPDGSYEGYDI